MGSGKSVDFRSSVLMVDNVPDGLDEFELRCHFIRFGEVSNTEMMDGCAKITFTKRADAQKALSEGTEFRREDKESVELSMRFVEAEEPQQASVLLTADDEVTKTVIT